MEGGAAGRSGGARRQRTSLLARSRGDAPPPEGAQARGTFSRLRAAMAVPSTNLKSALALALVVVLLLLLTSSGGLVARTVQGGGEAQGASGRSDVHLQEDGRWKAPASFARQEAIEVSPPPATAVVDHVLPWGGNAVPRKVGASTAQLPSAVPVPDLDAARAEAASVAAAWTTKSPPEPPPMPPPPRPPRSPTVEQERGSLFTNLDVSNATATVPPLTRELVQVYSEPLPVPITDDGEDAVFDASRRVVVVSFTDWKPHGSASQQTQALLASNWVHTVVERRMSCLVVLCETKAPVVGPPSEVGTRLVAGPSPAEDGAASSSHLGCGLAWSDLPACVTNPRVGRWYMVAQMLSWGFDVFSTDPDVSMLRNPLPYFSALIMNHPAVDVFTSSDSNNGVYTHGGGGDEKPKGGINSPDGTFFSSVTRVTWNDSYSMGSTTTRWAASFPQLPITGGYVYRNELRGHDSMGVDHFLAALRSGSYDIGLESPGNCQPHQYNSGCMYWRATPRASKLIAKWTENLDTINTNPTADDQVPINVVAKTGAQHCAPGGVGSASSEPCGNDRLLNSVGGGTACLGLLNLVQFANGFVYTTSRAHEQHGVTPYVLHATYAGDKVLKLREEGLLHDPPDWYDGGTLFLTYDVDLPLKFFANDTLKGADAPDGVYTWQNHWYLVQYQLQQLRAALAVAQALGRVLILPRMACTCECFFYPGKDCVIEGHRVRLPHVCPTDHWLRPGRLTQPHREPGFLDNPRVPASVGADVAVVSLCPSKEAPGCDDAETTPLGARRGITVREAMDDTALRTALAPVSSSRVLRVRNVTSLWAGFAVEADATKFNASLAHGVLGSWCCLKTHPNGENDEKVEVWKAPYSWEGEPKAVPDFEDVGKCGA